MRLQHKHRPPTYYHNNTNIRNLVKSDTYHLYEQRYTRSTCRNDELKRDRDHLLTSCGIAYSPCIMDLANAPSHCGWLHLMRHSSDSQHLGSPRRMFHSPHRPSLSYICVHFPTLLVRFISRLIDLAIAAPHSGRVNMLQDSSHCQHLGTPISKHHAQGSHQRLSLFDKHSNWSALVILV